jgi:hypothetical protein
MWQIINDLAQIAQSVVMIILVLKVMRLEAKVGK